MQHLYYYKKTKFSKIFLTPLITKDLNNIQGLVRFCALCRIKPDAPPLVQTSVNSFEFQPCDCSTQAERLRVSLYIGIPKLQHLHAHYLQHGLPGSLIPFDSHAFVPQRQY